MKIIGVLYKLRCQLVCSTDIAMNVMLFFSFFQYIKLFFLTKKAYIVYIVP